MLASRAGRIAGLLGLVMGGLAVAALGATFMAMNPLVLMGAIAATALWAVVAGVLLMKRTI